MFVSVVIPTYNRLEKVCVAIKSVLNQTYQNFEIIVIDDGSSDETYLYLKKNFGNKVRVFYQDHRGVSAARNFGIKKSVGDWIAFLDSDDIWLEEKLEKQVKYLNNSRLEIAQSNEIWYRNNIRVNPTKRNLKEGGNIFEKSIKLCCITISSVILSRKIFEKYGYFDEDMFVCEDYDLWLRITQNKEVGLLEENLLIRYGGHLDQLSKKYLVIDRFRLYSLLKFYTSYSQNLSVHKKQLVLNEIMLKWNFIKEGRKKRNLEFRLMEELIQEITLKESFIKIAQIKKLLLTHFEIS